MKTAKEWLKAIGIALVITASVVLLVLCANAFGDEPKGTRCGGEKSVAVGVDAVEVNVPLAALDIVDTSGGFVLDREPPYASVSPSTVCGFEGGRPIFRVGWSSVVGIDAWSMKGLENQVDSVVWYIRSYEIPGVHIEDNLNPHLGWVRLGSSDHMPYAVAWKPDWCAAITAKHLESYYDFGARPCRPDGRYLLVGYMYLVTGIQIYPQFLVVQIGDI